MTLERKNANKVPSSVLSTEYVLHSFNYLYEEGGRERYTGEGGKGDSAPLRSFPWSIGL